MKHAKQILSSILILLMLCGTACGQQDPPDTTDTTAPPAVNDVTTAAPETDDGKDENGFLRDTLPEDLRYNDETIRILTWSDVEHNEFEVEQTTGDLVSDALYNRNRKVEERLGVKLDFHGIPGNSSQANNYVAHVANAIQSNSGDFDMCAAYSMTIASAAQQGYLLNLLDLPYLNFEMPWWPERLTKEAVINDKLFFASGDISANVIYMMYACFFNRDLIEAYGLEDPQELALQDKWTFAKFFEMTKGVYKDLNGNGQRDADDQYAYRTPKSPHTDPWLYNAGVSVIERNADGDLVLSPDFLGEKTIGIVEMLNNQLWNSTDCAYMAGTDATTLEPFANNAVMFCFDRVRQSLTYFANTTVDYGVVPCPVISADQDFVTVIGNPFTLYALPIDCRDPEMLSAVMECYASESYRQVTPALFEITFKVKYSDSEINGQMFDIIRESVTFDLGRLYFKVCGALGYYQVAIQNNENQWGSTAAYLQKIAPPQLESIQKAYE